MHLENKAAKSNKERSREREYTGSERCRTEARVKVHGAEDTDTDRERVQPNTTRDLKREHLRLRPSTSLPLSLERV